jgi:hypothetical protein
VESIKVGISREERRRTTRTRATNEGGVAAIARTELRKKLRSGEGVAARARAALRKKFPNEGGGGAAAPQRKACMKIAMAAARAKPRLTALQNEATATPEGVERKNEALP